MTAHTDGTLLNDDDVIALLREAATIDAPPDHYDVDLLLANGRRARRRRQALIVPVSGIGVAGIAVLVFGLAHNGIETRQPLSIVPAATGTQESPQSAYSDLQILQEAFGDDFVISPGAETGPIPGNVTVRAGSPSADGLPAGVTLWTQLIAGGTPASQLEEFCAPMVEKGFHRSACTRHVLAAGKVVYVQTGPSNPWEYKSASRGIRLPSDLLRVIYVQPNDQLVIVDLVASEDEGASTPEKRDAVRAWLDRMTSRLATAATDPRVDTSSGVSPSKPGRR